MVFPESIVEKAWERSAGYCECTRIIHEHEGKCNKVLLKNKRRDKDSLYGWEAHSIGGRVLKSLSDCEILCWDCYAKAF